jgi:general secretion pathway protein A
MFLKFFGLTSKPFELTPNPEFLFLTPSHREALAQLIYGIQEQKGFILMTGEVGTGKTTVLRALVQRLDGHANWAFIINSTLPFDEMLEYALADLGVSDPRGTRAQRLIALNRFLIEQRRAGRNTILIVDEAQNLSVETLEQIRLLSNFETNSAKLIQIVLSGQPELYAKLQRFELRQLKQRIGLRCRLAPMTVEQVGQYIRNHLKVAAATKELFTDEAIERIAAYSRGVPRVVNIVADHCLLSAYANQTQLVDAAIVKRAIAYLEDNERDSRARWKPVASQTGMALPRRVIVAASAGVVAVAAGVAGAMSPSGYPGALHAAPATLVAVIGGVVRWVTQWWGS